MRTRTGIFTLLAVTLLLAAVPALAQRTVVTGTVTDPNGLPYAGGTIQATLTLPVGAGGATLAGAQIQGQTGRLTLDSTGAFLMQLPDNNVLLPGGTQWRFDVAISPGISPPAGTGPQTCTATLTITGVSQSVTSSFSSCPTLSLISASIIGGLPVVFTNPQPGDVATVNDALQLVNGAVRVLPNNQAGVSYALAGGSGSASDNLRAVNRTNAGAISDTIAAAGSAGFPSGWAVYYTNTNALGGTNATLTATTSVFKGASGTTTLTAIPQERCLIISDGTDYQTGCSLLGHDHSDAAHGGAIPPASITGTAAITANVQVFTASGTWTKPAGAKAVFVRMIAGGGSGGNGFTSATAAGGGGGGSPGCVSEKWFSAALLGATETVTVGVGGIKGGGANPGSSVFGSWLQAGSANNGANGTATTAGGGGPGTRGNRGCGTAGGAGGSGAATNVGSAGGTNSASTEFPSAGAGGASSNGTTTAAGGAAANGDNSHGTTLSGGTAGAAGSSSNGGLGGTGVSAAANEPAGGGGGGGGGSGASGFSGGGGGTPGLYGAGGGGGGGGGVAGGLGADGQVGIVIVITVF